MKLTAWKGRVTTFATALVSLVLVAALVTVVVAVAERRAQQQHIQTLNRSTVSLIMRGLGDALSNVRGDVLALAQPWMIEQLLAAPDDRSARVRVERFFTALAGARGDYAQIRLIDVRGQEIARVDTVGGVSHVIPVDQLQNKAGRPYVAAVNALAGGRIYVSRFDLNIEHGQVVMPREPTLRVGTPIFDDRGTRLGMVIINLDGRHLLGRMHDDAGIAEGQVWLADRDGNWLVGPDPARDWRFVTPGQPQAGLASDLPAVWSIVRAKPSGQQRGSFGLLTFDSLALTGEQQGNSDEPMLRVVALAPPAIFGAVLFDRAHLLIYALALPILLILAGLLSHLRIRLAGAEGEIRANSRLLQDIFEHSSLSMKVKDLQGRIVRANAKAGTLIGRSPEELLGQSIESVATAATATLIRAHDREVIESGRVTTYEEQVEYLGGIRTLLTTRFPVTDERGDLAGIGAMSVDITPRIRMEEWLRLTKDQAEAANVAKATFLANMSHELRTPLNSIIGLGELLLEQAEEQAQDPISIESMQRVVGAGRHLLGLINDILDISRVEAGHVQLNPEPLLVSSLVDTVLSSLRPLATAHGNVLSMDVPHDPGMVMIDPMRMRQVLLNLVGNANKFTRDGSIVVRMSRADDLLQITVADTGIGMNDEQMGRIFKPFEQADRSIAKRFGGSGLGLAISRQLVELMGGEISVTSRPGEGSVFCVTVPTGRLDASEDVVLTTDALQRTAGDELTVLVVDDDPDARHLLCTTLERAGLRVATASSGVEALETVRAARPAVMLLDILLGDMSGWDVLTLLRADPRHADLPVILCTVTDPDHRTATLGVIEHLTKPINRHHLTTLVRRFVGSGQPAGLLVVDDEDEYREQLAAVLRRAGHQVRTAADGEQAMQLMREEPPQLLLLDLIMPGMDGMAVVMAMRNDPALISTQVVLVTAADVPGDVLRQLNERAVLLMRKDESDLAHITARVKELIAQLERADDQRKDAQA